MITRWMFGFHCLFQIPMLLLFWATCLLTGRCWKCNKIALTMQRKCNSSNRTLSFRCVQSLTIMGQGISTVSGLGHCPLLLELWICECDIKVSSFRLFATTSCLQFESNPTVTPDTSCPPLYPTVCRFSVPLFSWAKTLFQRGRGQTRVAESGQITKQWNREIRDSLSGCRQPHKQTHQSSSGKV